MARPFEHGDEPLVSIICGDLLTSKGLLSFSRETPHHGVSYLVNILLSNKDNILNVYRESKCVLQYVFIYIIIF